MKKIIRCHFFLTLGVLLFSLTLTGCASTGYKKMPRALNLEKGKYLPLSAVCSTYNLSWEWDGFSKVINLKNIEQDIRIYLGSDIISNNGLIQKLDSPVKLYEGLVMVPASFSRFFISEEITPFPTGVSKGMTIKRVVIDAGHGGKDPGAVGVRGVKEKDIVLDIAQRLKRELKNRNVEVILTRDRDEFIPLNERAAIANRANADFFISIHANAARCSTVKGFEAFYLSHSHDDHAKAVQIRENAAIEFEKGIDYEYSSNLNATLWDMILNENRIESVEMANSVSYELKRMLALNTRYIKGAMFYVLKDAQMPAVLLEVGYLTNVSEADRLKNSYYRQMIAEAVASGVVRYKRQFELTNGFTR